MRCFFRGVRFPYLSPVVPSAGWISLQGPRWSRSWVSVSPHGVGEETRSQRVQRLYQQGAVETRPNQGFNRLVPVLNYFGY